MVGRTSRNRRPWVDASLVLTVGWAVLRRPRLWPEALRQAPAVASAPYRAFRSVTAYGDPHRLAAASDVLAWLRWAQRFRQVCAGDR